MLKKKLLSSLEYTIRSFLDDGRVTEYRCPDTGAKTLRWPQDLLDEVLGGGGVEVGSEREIVVIDEEEEEDDFIDLSHGEVSWSTWWWCLSGVYEA